MAQWRGLLAYVLGLIPAAALFSAGVIKGADPALFAQQIGDHGLSPESWSPVLAYVFVAVELLLGLALVLWVMPRTSLLLAMGLLVFFIVVTAAAWAMGRGEACGCFGRLASRGPAEVIQEDLLLLLPAAVSFLLVRRRRGRASSRRRVLFVLLALAALGYTAAGGFLPLDGLATGLSPGSDLSDMAVEGLRTPLERGRVLVVLAEPECSSCLEALPQLSEIARGEAARVVYVIQGTAREASGWRLEHLPPFAVAHASEKVLRQYYRRLPAAFLVEDGILRRTYWGRLPAPADLP
ncbi:MAG: hypothetical protein GF355_07715 [Candidatus Eisenbacteria bacterium]|nr:hypothetical protein [Candidatus Eisenbacteria bacterium]